MKKSILWKQRTGANRRPAIQSLPIVGPFGERTNALLAPSGMVSPANIIDAAGPYHYANNSTAAQPCGQPSGKASRFVKTTKYNNISKGQKSCKKALESGKLLGLRPGSPPAALTIRFCSDLSTAVEDLGVQEKSDETILPYTIHPTSLLCDLKEIQYTIPPPSRPPPSLL